MPRIHFNIGSFFRAALARLRLAALLRRDKTSDKDQHNQSPLLPGRPPEHWVRRVREAAPWLLPTMEPSRATMPRSPRKLEAPLATTDVEHEERLRRPAEVAGQVPGNRIIQPSASPTTAGSSSRPGDATSPVRDPVEEGPRNWRGRDALVEGTKVGSPHTENLGSLPPPHHTPEANKAGHTRREGRRDIRGPIPERTHPALEFPGLDPPSVRVHEHVAVESPAIRLPLASSELAWAFGPMARPDLTPNPTPTPGGSRRRRISPPKQTKRVRGRPTEPVSLQGDSLQDPWPRLPRSIPRVGPPRSATIRTEAAHDRCLDQEQRGIRWNAWRS